LWKLKVSTVLCREVPNPASVVEYWNLVDFIKGFPRHHASFFRVQASNE
jgi:hypothetical protein